MNFKYLFIISLAVVAITVSALFSICKKYNIIRKIRTKLGYNKKYVPTFKEEVLVRGWSSCIEGLEADIVFTGDSITRGFNWNQSFCNTTVYNLSVGGDGIEALDYRKELVKKLNPKKIFIMIGINNIKRFKAENTIIKYYEKILSYFKTFTNNIYVESILPVRKESRISNEKIDKINILIKNMCRKNGVTFIDLNRDFKDENNELKENYSKDGIHINDAGYELWKSKIEQYVCN